MNEMLNRITSRNVVTRLLWKVRYGLATEVEALANPALNREQREALAELLAMDSEQFVPVELSA